MKILEKAFLVGCKSSDRRIKNSKVYIDKKIKQMKNKSRYNILYYYEVGKIVNLISKEYKVKSSYTA